LGLYLSWKLSQIKQAFLSIINHDLIKEQIKIALGERISGRNYFPLMHANECRINAEDIF
jgi:biotin carboxylase